MGLQKMILQNIWGLNLFRIAGDRILWTCLAAQVASTARTRVWSAQFQSAKWQRERWEAWQRSAETLLKTGAALPLATPRPVLRPH